MDQASKNQVATWLLACCALIFAMVVVGGVTRLTHSGLSMVEWQPLIGTLPPLNQMQWDEVFHKYQQTPEYLKINRGMALEEFKGIFWWEYFHRLLGRSIGLVFLLPFLYFLARKKIDKPMMGKFTGIFLLGGLQGAMGWYMVKSGLVNNPHVSQYRLTAHLGLAFLIYTAIFWAALGLLFPKKPSQTDGKIRTLQKFSTVLACLIFVMVLSGGFVAGTRAGFTYNTFPLMNGNWIPQDIFLLEPWYLNFFENLATVQFDHRMIAWLLAFLVPLFWLRSRQIALPVRPRLYCNLFLAMLAVQIGLGIGTLLLVVPVHLAATHQAGALLLFTIALLTTHELHRTNGTF